MKFYTPEEDRKLRTLIRMHLHITEIAARMGRTVGSVEKRAQRLKESFTYRERNKYGPFGQSPKEDQIKALAKLSKDCFRYRSPEDSKFLEGLR